MSLAHAFGPKLAQASAQRQLVPGVVIKLYERMDDGNEQEKWFVVVQVDESTVTCVINTLIPKLIQRKPELLKCQVEISKGSHPFMKHDSHLDCTKVFTYRTEDVIKQLAAKPEWIMGTADSALLSKMVVALSDTPLLTSEEAGAYCAALKGVIQSHPAAQPASQSTSAD